LKKNFKYFFTNFSEDVYDYRKVSDDLRELGNQCGIHRPMRLVGIRSHTGYAKRKYKEAAHFR